MIRTHSGSSGFSTLSSSLLSVSPAKWARNASRARSNGVSFVATVASRVSAVITRLSRDRVASCEHLLAEEEVEESLEVGLWRLQQFELIAHRRIRRGQALLHGEDALPA